MGLQAGTPVDVSVRDVSKEFRIPKEQVHTFKERAMHPLRRASFNHFSALEGVSFDVSRGEFFGIVGRNGSGKSTLLKCLAGIYPTDSGSIAIDGQVSTFIELGVGFNPDLAARDNVAINAAMLGLSPREARRRFDAVMDFSELHEFVDLKLKNYSSGMMVRLAFAVMIEIEADVLLIDEVLAVGDAAFQQKCFDEFERIRREGKTVLLVTHDMGAVRRFCDRGILLEKGKVAGEGDPEYVGDRYLDLNFSDAARERAVQARDAGAQADARHEPVGDGRATILDAWFEDASGKRSTSLHNGAAARFSMRVRFNSRVVNPAFSIELCNGAGIPLFSASSAWGAEESGEFAAGEEATWRAEFDNLLGPDRYSAHTAVTLGGGAVLAKRLEREPVTVSRSAPTSALVDLPFRQVLERSERTPAGQAD